MYKLSSFNEVFESGNEDDSILVFNWNSGNILKLINNLFANYSLNKKA